MKEVRTTRARGEEYYQETREREEKRERERQNMGHLIFSR